MSDDIVDRLRMTSPTEPSQRAYLTFEQTTMLEGAEEIKRLRIRVEELELRVRTLERNHE